MLREDIFEVGGGELGSFMFLRVLGLLEWELELYERLAGV
jgi:hypothetical protein